MADLVIENATGLSNANSYCSLAEYKDFALLNGYTTDHTDPELAVFLVRATNFIDSFEDVFVGKRLNPSQALAFPRKAIGFSCNDDPHLYSMNSLKKAVLYAVVVQVEGFNLLPIEISKDNFISKEKIEGAIEVQYSNEYFSKNLLAKFPMVERCLNEYIGNSRSQIQVSR